MLSSMLRFVPRWSYALKTCAPRTRVLKTCALKSCPLKTCASRTRVPKMRTWFVISSVVRTMLLITLSVTLSVSWAESSPELLAESSPELLVDSHLTYVPDAYVPQGGAVRLIPTPQEDTLLSGTFTLPEVVTLSLAASLQDNPLLTRTLEDTRGAFEQVGVQLELTNNLPAFIRIMTLADGASANRLQALDVSAVNQREGYVLAVTADMNADTSADAGTEAGIDIIAADVRGALYGLMSLQQLLEPTMPARVIRDYPLHDWRVAMIYLDRNAELNERLIPLLAAHKFNALLVMSNYIVWDSAPELRMPGSAPKDLVRQNIATARAYGLDVIPLLETFGHVEWLFQNGQNNDLLLDPSAQSRFAYNPLEPRTYDVLLPIIDEVIDLFDPQYIHIGHDEVRNVVPFPADSGSFVDAFIADTRRLHTHLAAAGVGTMMWHDVLLAPDVLPRLSDLPTDIVVTSWNYNPAARYPTIDTLQAAGFRVLGASWYEPDNIRSYAQYAAGRSRGMLQTRWTGYFGNSSLLAGQYPQAYAYLHAAQHFWQPSAPALEDAPARFRQAWLPDAASTPVAGYLVDVSAVANRHLRAAEGDWLGRGADFDMAALLASSNEASSNEASDNEASNNEPVIAGVRFQLGDVIGLQGQHRRVQDDPARVQLELNTSAGQIAFLHTTGWAVPETGEEIGRYVVHYQDGSSTPIPLFYGVNISAWTELDVIAMNLQQAWRGETASGLPVSADLLMWQNPFPERPISHITLMSQATMANPLVLGVTVLE